MNQLRQRLEVISSETGDGPSNNAKSKSKDEFKNLKQTIAANVRDVRQALKERDALLQKGASGTKETVQKSYKIREQIKQAKEDAQKLANLQRKEAGKKKGKDAEQVEQRLEVVQLVWKHIEECEALEKRRYQGKNSEARVELFGGGRGGGAGAGPSGVGPVSRVPVGGGTELPEIDLETQDGLKALQRKDQQIDEGLDQIAEGVNDLRHLAIDMRDEVKVQSAMVDEITHKVDAASGHLTNLNKRMKKTLANTRSADRFILDFILLVILLGVVGYIVSLVSGVGR